MTLGPVTLTEAGRRRVEQMRALSAAREYVFAAHRMGIKQDATGGLMSTLEFAPRESDDRPETYNLTLAQLEALIDAAHEHINGGDL